LLDGDLAGRRPQGNTPLIHRIAVPVRGLFQQLNPGGTVQCLHHTLRNKGEGKDQGEGIRM
jgi:hypothetical protein